MKVSQLVDYGISNQLLDSEDRFYAINKICDLLDINEYEILSFNLITSKEPSQLLEPLLDFAVNKEIISPDTITQRDIFEAKLLDVIIPRPSQINEKFYSFDDSVLSTEYFYDLSQKSNYIKTSRTSKNIAWKSPTKYGDMEITINLSKPEKDPRDIIAAGKTTTNKYPKCLLCKENVGYNGKTTNVGRTSHRIIPVDINNEEFYLQYSPYVYYNEHCIVLQKEHQPMEVTINTFKRLFDFVDLFPHYFLGSNAGLPIVGGSILSHEHYQGGKHHFPIEKAKVIHNFTLEDVEFEQLYWPLSVIRLKSKNRVSLVKYADRLYRFWEKYSNTKIGIHASTGETPHNAITPIARKNGDLYIIDITLRNNLTSELYPLGIFHPHPENHHIKKENIGLIEVMGLAVLPARLSRELPQIKNALITNGKLTETNEKHSKWLDELKEIYDGENIDEFLDNQVAIKFMRCLENSGVFKQTDEGIKQFKDFMGELKNGINY